MTTFDPNPNWITNGQEAVVSAESKKRLSAMLDDFNAGRRASATQTTMASMKTSVRAYTYGPRNEVTRV